MSKRVEIKIPSEIQANVERAESDWKEQLSTTRQAFANFARSAKPGPKDSAKWYAFAAQLRLNRWTASYVWDHTSITGPGKFEWKDDGRILRYVYGRGEVSRPY